MTQLYFFFFLNLIAHFLWVKLKSNVFIIFFFFFVLLLNAFRLISFVLFFFVLYEYVNRGDDEFFFCNATSEVNLSNEQCLDYSVFKNIVKIFEYRLR